MYYFPIGLAMYSSSISIIPKHVVIFKRKVYCAISYLHFSGEVLYICLYLKVHYTLCYNRLYFIPKHSQKASALCDFLQRFAGEGLYTCLYLNVHYTSYYIQ